MTTRRALFITHAEVTIDPTIPVPSWRLSEQGQARHTAFSQSPAVTSVTSIYCSAERKAIDGAEILARFIAVRPCVAERLHENDRSATGFLPPAAFQATADRFFAYPADSIQGWERAVDAQARIVACVDQIVSNDKTTGDIAIVAHGGVGTLLLCQLAGMPIARNMDQPGTGGGHYFAFAVRDRSLIHGWRDIAR